MPRISVIIDVMDRKNLNFCLDSLILQKYPDFEAICVVFSKDNTIYEIDRRCAEHRFRNKTDADSYCYAKEIHL